MKYKISQLLEGTDFYIVLDSQGNLHYQKFNSARLPSPSSELLSSILKPTEEEFKDPKFQQVSTGYQHFLALSREGVPWAFGNNTSGQLGQGDAESRYTLVPINLKKICSVSAGERHGLALSQKGNVYQWGYATSSENSPFPLAQLPLKVLKLKNIVSIAAGSDHNLALDAKGRVFGWGHNLYLQLAIPKVLSLKKPKIIDNLPPITQIAAGKWYSLALSKEGDVFGFGTLNFNKLGRAWPTLPERLLIPKPVVNITMGWDSCFALDSSDNLWGWGKGLASTPQKIPLGPDLRPIFFANPSGKTTPPEYFEKTIRSFLKKEISL